MEEGDLRFIGNTDLLYSLETEKMIKKLIEKERLRYFILGMVLGAGITGCIVLIIMWG